jgi:quercetin dioxygenase-like cupin family protein
MVHSTIDENTPKDWFVGPWNSEIPVPIGYATTGVNEKHYHARMYEIYLVARGASRAVVNGQEVSLKAGDILVVEPGEVHTFTDSSADYLHYVIHAP